MADANPHIVQDDTVIGFKPRGAYSILQGRLTITSIFVWPCAPLTNELGSDFYIQHLVVTYNRTFRLSITIPSREEFEIEGPQASRTWYLFFRGFCLLFYCAGGEWLKYSVAHSEYECLTCCCVTSQPLKCSFFLSPSNHLQSQLTRQKTPVIFDGQPIRFQRFEFFIGGWWQRPRPPASSSIFHLGYLYHRL
ncbi:hypothetical protein GALMADRAFT_926479 [Galerina marginata CBS 339.88]|uniref:Uncharacterized protein n=1 Tax=Galerina marginata (strain CBS 339.88) TaxID=685588 RepID=A0A067SGX4_GALM3|nr:hypothetical protein GALMADRAFT_926479 [Galerina marginata CBS 339.88]